MFKFKHLTQTQLGKLFGVSSQQIGKWLVALGLRTSSGKPSAKAFAGGFCTQFPTRNDGYCWGWDAKKTSEALEKAGHRYAFPPPDDLVKVPFLKGPFSLKRSSENGYEILNAEGQVSLWAYGKENVESVVLMLNLAAEQVS